MANPYSKCGLCLGNMWPPTQIFTHRHLTIEEKRAVLKRKYRVGKRGWNKAANPRTGNSHGPTPKRSGKTLVSRRRAYGPF